MLELLFGNQNTERILFTLLIQEKCYAKQLSDRFESAVSGFQSTFEKLEKASILISFKEGSIRYYQMNPRYPFLKELLLFLEKAFLFIPQNIKNQYYNPIKRTRPRRKGKPL